MQLVREISPSRLGLLSLEDMICLGGVVEVGGGGGGAYHHVVLSVYIT